MRLLDADFADSLAAARDGGIAPVYFLHVVGRNRDTGAAAPLGVWSGDEDITINVQTPEGGLTSRTYFGGCNLAMDGLPYVADLTDESVTLSMSQIADPVQQMIRGYDARLAYAEIHATTWDGGRFSSTPSLEWIGIVDDAMIDTPSVGGDGSVSLTIRSEIMTQLTQINPAKSSHQHQKRRNAVDKFSEYSGIVKDWNPDWYKE
ncbi:hypothetical protein [Paracoccus homiensis]|uniref:DUF2163 domain-containing protein n=1 Tax=Paracoccus homiensis TaxID=364199 RepID=A0A1I0J0V0_9RHOB|nr:hypothetical protein [Paracoccus homiensis]SEU03364.1 hypothetical protein SAMN04489858_12067 [Paracoccus homiensis]